MGYEVEVEHQAARSLARIERGDRSAARRIVAAVRALGADPRPAGAIKLTGGGGWRIRVGTYRVVYLIEDSIRVVTVTRIGHRRDVYEER